MNANLKENDNNKNIRHVSCVVSLRHTSSVYLSRSSSN